MGRMRRTDRQLHRSTTDLATAWRMLAALRGSADVRGRKVRRLRAAIRARRYENRLKLEVASDRLADDLLPPLPL